MGFPGATFSPPVITLRAPGFQTLYIQLAMMTVAVAVTDRRRRVHGGAAAPICATPCQCSYVEPNERIRTERVRSPLEGVAGAVAYMLALSAITPSPKCE